MFSLTPDESYRLTYTPLKQEVKISTQVFCMGLSCGLLTYTIIETQTCQSKNAALTYFH